MFFKYYENYIGGIEELFLNFSEKIGLQIKSKGLHTTPRGLVVRAGRAPKLGQMAFDSSGKRVGNVFDVFGPVKSPYVIIKPASGLSKADLRKFIGSDILMEEEYGKNKKEAKGVPRMQKR